MTRSFARRSVLAGVVLAVVAFAFAAPGFVLAGAPALLLVCALLAGWFPGEDTIARLRERRNPPRSRRDRTAVVARPRPTPRASRLLISFSLANRPPPATLLSA